MTKFTKNVAPETTAEPTTTRIKEEFVARPGADITSVESSPRINWLEKWEHLTPDGKDRTKDQVRAILLLKAEIARNRDPSTYDLNACMGDLELAGQHVAEGGSGAIAAALLETVQARLEEEKRFVELNRQQYFSGRAVQMLIIGVLVQGAGLTALIYSLSFLMGGIPIALWGVKTLSILAVVVSGIAGSLARIVHECQSGVADETTLRNTLSMAATTAARPLLAAVLALFVFALFQSGLIGIPFEASAEVSAGGFAREDFFFVAIAFLIGFNDAVGLNLLAFVGKYRPQQNPAGTH